MQKNMYCHRHGYIWLTVFLLWNILPAQGQEPDREQRPKWEIELAGALDNYGLWEVDEGTIGKSNVSWNKTIHGINTLTSLNALAVNLLAGISNVATGTVMMRIESFCGEFFNVKDTTKADLIYFE